MMNIQESKKQNKVNIRPITYLLFGLTFLTIILLSMMFGNRKDAVYLRTDKINQVDNLEDSAFQSKEEEILALVHNIDLSKQQITLFNIHTGHMLTLSYTGGSNITDKYGQVTTIGQIPVGSIVEVGYLASIDKLVSLQVSNKAWEYVDVNNLTIDPSAKIMKIGSMQYKYTDKLFILNGEDFITVEHLAKQDQLTIRGYDQIIWSITVTKGHGTVRLVDVEAFLGGNVTVGYEATKEIEEDLVITVREGNYNLTVENGEYSATKNVTIYRDEETVVSLSDMGPIEEEKSRITFEISPFGADLFIDGELTSYANPVSLAYGKHDIQVSLGGYTTYRGVLNVKEFDQVIKIGLPETSSKKEVSVSVEEDDNSADTEVTEMNISQVEVEVDSNKDYMIDEDHFIYVQSPEGASIYLNGAYMGKSPVGFEKLIGKHILTLIKDGYLTKSYTIEVEDDGLDRYLTFPDLVPMD